MYPGSEVLAANSMFMQGTHFGWQISSPAYVEVVCRMRIAYGLDTPKGFNSLKGGWP